MRSGLSICHKGIFLTTQEDLKNLRFENIPLAQQLDKETDVDLASISNSFENVLLQVDKFYSHLCILREKV